MIQRLKTFFKEIDGSIWFYLILFVAGLSLLRFSFFIHPDTSGDFWGNVRVEFVGFCFDVLLLGLIFSIFMQRYQRKQDIKRWQEEIDDYRGWDEKEAVFRIVGNIKRLNREKRSAIRLQFCYLRKAKLTKTNLRGAILFSANLENARLGEADLSNADLRFANLKSSYLVGSILEGANLCKADFEGAQWGIYLAPDSTGFKFLIGNAPMYSFLDGAIVDSPEWIENLKNENNPNGSLLNVYHILTQNGRYFVRVKPEKRSEYENLRNAKVAFIPSLFEF